MSKKTWRNQGTRNPGKEKKKKKKENKSKETGRTPKSYREKATKKRGKKGDVAAHRRTLELSTFPMFIVLLLICSFPNTKKLGFTKRGVDGMTDIESVLICLSYCVFSLYFISYLYPIFECTWPWPPMDHVLSCWRLGAFSYEEGRQADLVAFECFPLVVLGFGFVSHLSRKTQACP